MTRTRMTRCATAALALSLLLAMAPSAVATTGGEDDFRDELGRFFESLRDVSGEAGAGAATVDELSPETVRELQRALAGVPGWQDAPRRLAATMPTELRERLQRLTAQAAAEAAELDDFRRDLNEWGVATSLLPRSALAERGYDATTLAAQRRMVEGLDTAGLARIEQRLRPDLTSARAELFAQLPAEVADGVRRLAAHGALDTDEMRELERFRAELSAFVDATATLPATVHTGLDADAAATLRATLSDATPEMLYLLRDRLDTPAMRRTMEGVARLSALGGLDADQRASVESFRTEFTGLLRETDAAMATDADLAAWADRLDAMSPEETFLLRERLGDSADWRQLPRAWAVAARPEVTRTAELAALGTLPAGERAALDSFRDRLADWLESLDDPAAVPAAAAVRAAEPSTLVLMQALYEEVPADEVPAAMSTLGAIDLGEIALPGLPGVYGDCGAFQVVCDFFDGLISGVSTAVNAVKNTVNSIASAVSNLGDTLTGFWEDLVMVFTPESLGAAFGIVGDWWTALPTIPGLPCPSIGTDLGPFGVVGNREDAIGYNRNVWVINEVIDIVPDTEISTSIKVALKVVWGAVQYLGVCLDTAADTVAVQQTDAFRADALGSLDSLASSLGDIDGDIAGVGVAVATVDQKVVGLTSDVSAFRDALETQVDDFRSLALRLQIERDLLESGGRRIASFQLPEAYGGVLELVREIVADTIDNSGDAGADVNGALAKLGQGDAAFADGDYQEAYSRYRMAYRLSVGPCDTCD